MTLFNLIGKQINSRNSNEVSYSYNGSDTEILKYEYPNMTEYTRLQCRDEGKFVVMGIPSHTQYTFEDGIEERTCLVKNEDVPDLLAKIITRGCCGNPRETYNLFSVW